MKPLTMLAAGLLLGLALLVGGCHTTHEIQHNVKVEPIEIRLDVHIQADEELDDFFGFQDEMEEEIESEGEGGAR